MIGILNKEEIEEVLQENILGRIGFIQNNKPKIIPINYLYNGKYIIAHSAAGEKIKAMRNNPTVCFEVEAVKNQQNWKSVLAEGVYSEILDERERYEAMKLFVDKMLKLKVSTTAHPPEMHTSRQHSAKPNPTVVIYKIYLSEKTGRFENDGTAT
ncbi:MAG TPA: pyridoxamine 5'-phosphate oxidase family protein [Lacibacter sp.]|nr:pyridoxamine 5'-phosphate oxidase family protein [Lacibacter sp.]